MKRGRIFRADPVFGWESASSIFERIAAFKERGFVRRESLIQGLRSLGIHRFQSFSKSLALPFVQSTDVMLPFSDCCQANRLTQVALTSLLTVQQSGCGFLFWHKTFNELFRVHRWLRQQTAQSRVQSCFLVGFVPTVSVVMMGSQSERILTNMATLEGKMIFTLALMFYLLGVLSVFVLLSRSRFNAQFSELISVGGRLNFLTELICSDGPSKSRLNRLAEVCQLSGRHELTMYARRLSLGLNVPRSFQRAILDPEEEDFLKSFGSVFLASARASRIWLRAKHERAFENFQAQESQKAALLSLRLLLPMAIFFLPALFLILALSGFSFQADALN